MGKSRKRVVGRRGVFSEYLNRRTKGENLDNERKRLLGIISSIRKRPILVMASDLMREANVPTSIQYTDILPFQELLEGLTGKTVDILIETPGGYAEVAEDLVKLLRNRFEKVSFIIPGWAKSAGTIMTMAGDEILMGPSSALGPIDAQMVWNNKMFSAQAFLKSLEEMKKEADDPDKGLSRAYVPILQQISPGEIQTAQNALNFSQKLVSEWLEKYKFQDWTTHKSGEPVKDSKRRDTAKRIAQDLNNHQKWLTHSRSLNIQDLREIGLRIVDYSQCPELNDAIRRYHALIHIAFESNLYKIFETEYDSIGKYWNVQTSIPNVQGLLQQKDAANSAEINFKCPTCSYQIPLHIRLKESAPDAPSGRIPYPKGDIAKCPRCQGAVNLAEARVALERELKRKVVPL